jgi:hypothetical protein
VESGATYSEWVVRILGMYEEGCLERGVGAVAENGTGAVIASAKVYGPGLGYVQFYWRSVGGFVAAIAERLVGAQSAGAPEMAFFRLQPEWDKDLFGQSSVQTKVVLLAGLLGMVDGWIIAYEVRGKPLRRYRKVCGSDDGGSCFDGISARTADSTEVG